ncbi:MAG: hypothetical protein IKI49_02580 [Oscillospiraceae bacterium]|nr:hypothetical protein [Oscillospiraceae bacterium]
MLFVPNILWAKRKPIGYNEAVGKENRLLGAFERAGEVAVTAALVIFKDFDPAVRVFPNGIYFNMRVFFWVIAFALMILYEFYWIRYFRRGRTMKDFYGSFAGFPVAGATLPVLAAIILGIYSKNMILLAAAAMLGVGHIGIHLAHRRDELSGAEE